MKRKLHDIINAAFEMFGSFNDLPGWTLIGPSKRNSHAVLNIQNKMREIRTCGLVRVCRPIRFRLTPTRHSDRLIVDVDRLETGFRHHRRRRRHHRHHLHYCSRCCCHLAIHVICPPVAVGRVVMTKVAAVAAELDPVPSPRSVYSASASMAWDGFALQPALVELPLGGLLNDSDSRDGWLSDGLFCAL